MLRRHPGPPRLPVERRQPAGEPSTAAGVAPRLPRSPGLGRMLRMVVALRPSCAPWRQPRASRGSTHCAKLHVPQGCATRHPAAAACLRRAPHPAESGWPCALHRLPPGTLPTAVPFSSAGRQLLSFPTTSLAILFLSQPPRYPVPAIAVEKACSTSDGSPKWVSKLLSFLPIQSDLVGAQMGGSPPPRLKQITRAALTLFPLLEHITPFRLRIFLQNPECIGI